jgi:hypothetical protein
MGERFAELGDRISRKIKQDVYSALERKFSDEP